MWKDPIKVFFLKINKNLIKKRLVVNHKTLCDYKLPVRRDLKRQTVKVKKRDYFGRHQNFVVGVSLPYIYHHIQLIYLNTSP